MNHSENAHQWANKGKKQSSANSNIKYWDFKTIYSYGSHFILAKRIEFEGNEYIFLNENNYSNSTSKHKSHVWNACKHLETISVPFLSNGSFYLHQLPQIIDNLINEGLELFKKQLKAHTTFTHYQNGQSAINRAFRLNNLFKLGLDLDSKIDQDLRSQASEKAKLVRENFDLKQTQKREKAEKERLERREKERENLTNWLNNEYNGQLYNLPVYLRFNSDKSQIQTSHGAIVPTKEAFILLDKLRNGIDCKGYKIGNYTLIESTLDHVKIGCHVISWNVINNFFNV